MPKRAFRIGRDLGASWPFRVSKGNRHFSAYAKVEIATSGSFSADFDDITDRDRAPDSVVYRKLLNMTTSVSL